MKNHTPKEHKPDTKEEVLFDYDLQQEQARRRRSRFIAYAVFLDQEEEQQKEKTGEKPKGYQI